MELYPTIGLEMHCEIKTNSKNFSSAKNEYNDTPNNNIKPVDMAFPGSLPVVNKEAVRKSIIMALCLNCKVPEVLVFDRKNYYYPDLPKGYQITQNQSPIGVDGSLTIEVDGNEEEVLIHDIHLEEDTASLDHFFDHSLIDYNRAGVPLLECVTEPCIHSPEAAVAFLETMRNIYKYTDVSDADTKKGQIRCDVNVSLAPKDSKELGTKVEVKNINSFSAVYDAIKFEIKRQKELIETGKKDEINQETRRWDDETQSTISMRSKADAVDYKYFIDPNIPRIKLEDKWIEEIKSQIPELPLERKKRYISEYNLSEYDAGVITKEKDLADYFEECLVLDIDPKTAINWITVQVLGYLSKNAIEMDEFYLTPKMLKDIIDKQDKGDISSKQAKEVFFKALDEKKEPSVYLNKEGMTQLSDEDELTNIITTILDNNQKQVEEYKSGKDNLFDYFVGQVMKETRGKANPIITKEILKNMLDK